MFLLDTSEFHELPGTTAYGAVHPLEQKQMCRRCTSNDQSHRHTSQAYQQLWPGHDLYRLPWLSRFCAVALSARSADLQPHGPTLVQAYTTSSDSFRSADSTTARSAPQGTIIIFLSCSICVSNRQHFSN